MHASLLLTRHDVTLGRPPTSLSVHVENRLFRIHRHFFAENSPIFNSMFSLPRVPNAPGEGASDENPIYLSGVTELEFETLLRYFYKG